MAAHEYTTDPDGFMKRCPKCPQKGLQPATAFYKNAQKRTGLSVYCRACINASGYSYRRTPAYRSAQRSYVSRPVVRARRRPGNRRRQDRFRFSVKGAATIVRYRMSEHGKAVKRAVQARGRARKRGLPAMYTRHNEAFLRAYWDDACAVCGDKRGLWKVIALDHWIPLSSSACPGTVPGNMVPLCHAMKGLRGTIADCNVSKQGQEPRAWLIQKLGPRQAQRKWDEIQRFFRAAEAQATSGEQVAEGA